MLDIDVTSFTIVNPEQRIAFLSENATVEVYAPATVANMGVGFDILGFALDEPGDIVVATLCDEPGVKIDLIEGDEGKLPYDPQQNTAAVAASAVLRIVDENIGVSLTLKKGLPLASGLGSSAASAVAAAVAVNVLLGEPLSLEELLPACLEGEARVSGYHADNVGPSLLGGITLITGTEIDQIRHLPVPDGMYFALVTPHVAVPTATARAVLPQVVPLSHMVSQTGAVACLVDSLYRGDIEALAAAMEQDLVIEPAREHLMPLLQEVRSAAKNAGALSLIISGAGPTLCALCDSESVSVNVAGSMKAVYDEAQIGSTSRYTYIDTQGARIIAKM
jgi:homoserine kinase